MRAQSDKAQVAQQWPAGVQTELDLLEGTLQTHVRAQAALLATLDSLPVSAALAAVRTAAESLLGRLGVAPPPPLVRHATETASAAAAFASVAVRNVVLQFRIEDHSMAVTPRPVRAPRLCVFISFVFVVFLQFRIEDHSMAVTPRPVRRSPPCASKLCRCSSTAVRRLCAPLQGKFDLLSST